MPCNCQRKENFYRVYDATGKVVRDVRTLMEAKTLANRTKGTYSRI